MSCECKCNVVAHVVNYAALFAITMPIGQVIVVSELCYSTWHVGLLYVNFLFRSLAMVVHLATSSSCRYMVCRGWLSCEYCCGGEGGLSVSLV